MLMTIPFQTENHPNLDVIILRNENINEKNVKMFVWSVGNSDDYYVGIRNVIGVIEAVI